MPKASAAKKKPDAPAASPTINTGNATRAQKAADKAKAAAAAQEPGFDNKPVHTPTRSGATVTVACKIPGGLRLRFHRKIERTVEVKGGHGSVTQWDPDPETADIVLTGPAAPFGQMAKVPVVGGCGLTQGVSADLWRRWCEENSKHPALLNRQIFANEERGRVEGLAMDLKEEKSGLQRMVPDTDARIDRRRKKDGSLGKEAAIKTREDDD